MSPAWRTCRTVLAAARKGVDAQVWYATMAPAGTPEPVLARLHALITQVAKAPEFGARLIPLGFQPLTDASPEAFVLLARRGGALEDAGGDQRRPGGVGSG